MRHRSPRPRRAPIPRRPVRDTRTRASSLPCGERTQRVDRRADLEGGDVLRQLALQERHRVGARHPQDVASDRHDPDTGAQERRSPRRAPPRRERRWRSSLRPRRHGTGGAATAAPRWRPRRASGLGTEVRRAAGTAASRAAALLWHSTSSSCRVAVGHDPGARLHRGPPVGRARPWCGWRWPCRGCPRSRGSPPPRRRRRAWSARGRR